MATTEKTAKVKAPKAPIAVGARVQDILTKAALTRKITLDEITALEAFIGKLKAIMS